MMEFIKSVATTDNIPYAIGAVAALAVWLFFWIKLIDFSEWLYGAVQKSLRIRRPITSSFTIQAMFTAARVNLVKDSSRAARNAGWSIDEAYTSLRLQRSESRQNAEKIYRECLVKIKDQKRLQEAFIYSQRTVEDMVAMKHSVSMLDIQKEYKRMRTQLEGTFISLEIQTINAFDAILYTEKLLLEDVVSAVERNNYDLASTYSFIFDDAQDEIVEIMGARRAQATPDTSARAATAADPEAQPTSNTDPPKRPTEEEIREIFARAPRRPNYQPSQA
jgi:hypothetical protein